MSPLEPVALYGREIPPGGIFVPAALTGANARIRITMAAVDPTAEPQTDENGNIPAIPRSTLKIIARTPEDDDDDLDSDDEEEVLKALAAQDNSDDEEANGGPSDPAKSKKARQEAALKQLLAATQDDSDDDSDVEMEDAKVNGNQKKKQQKSKKGKEKAPLPDDDSDEDSDGDSEEDSTSEALVLCTLDTERNYQQPLDITFHENENVYFVVSGTHSVYLTGNYVMAADDEESDDEEDDYDLPPGMEDLIDNEADDSDDLDEIDGAERVKEAVSEDEDEEEAPKLVPPKKGKAKRPAEDEPESLDAMIATESQSGANDKLSKKQAKKLKNNKGGPVAKGSETISKEDKKVQFAKNLEMGQTGSGAVAKNKQATGGGKKSDKKSDDAIKKSDNKSDKKADEADKKKNKSSLGVKVVSGVTIDDRAIGKGRTAKAGDKVSMRYIGRLQSNGRVFDANKKGTPFRFNLGADEVIKGWDIGVAGMGVGGERRLTIPPQLAYGSQSMPDIPANSTLVFDVKLLEIK